MIAYILDKYASTTGGIEWIKDMIEIDSISVVKDYDYKGISSTSCSKIPNANKGDYIFVPTYAHQSTLTDSSSNIFTDLDGNNLITMALSGTEFVGIINNIEYANGISTIKIAEMETMFDEDIFLRSSNLKNVGIEDMLLNNIEHYYKNADGYGMGNEHITFSTSSHTRYTADIDAKDGIVNITELLAGFMKSSDVYIDWSVGANSINGQFKRNTAYEFVDLVNPNIVDTKIVTTQEIVSRIFVHFENETTGYSHDLSFILDTNGTMQSEPTIPSSTIIRAKGTTTSMNIKAKSYEEMWAKVREEFNKSSYSNKFTIKILNDGVYYQPRQFKVGSKIDVVSKDDAVTSIVSKVSYDTDDKLFTIECGSLDLSLTDKIRRIERNK